MRSHLIRVGIVFLMGLSLVGCDLLFKPKKSGPKEGSVSTPVVKGTVIAKVGNVSITLEDLNQEIDALNKQIPEERKDARITTTDQKLAYLKNEVVRRTLLYLDALDRGLDRKDEIVSVMEKTKQELLVLELLRQELEEIDVPTSEMTDYYEKNKNVDPMLKEQEERKIREIVVGSEQTAKDIMIQLLQGADFATLAQERSTAASARKGGDLGYVKQGDHSVQFEDVAFADTLEVGKVSSIFKTPDGFTILRLEEKRGGKEKPFSEVKEYIKNGLTLMKQREKIDAIVSNLQKKVTIQYFESEIR